MSDQGDPQMSYARAAGERPAPTTIHTGVEGLDARLVTIDAPRGAFPAYVAKPVGVEAAPVVIVVSEAFGLHEHIADVARRFAHQGYCAVAPNLMVRQGDPLAFDSVEVLVRDLLLHIPDEQVMEDLDATLEWAGRNGGDRERAFITGFCWGARWVWLYAARRRLAAATAWYGIVDGSGTFADDAARFPRHPLDVVDELKTPVLGLYGAQDEAIPVATVERMRDRLRSGSAAARASEIVVYPDAGHAFFADYRASYRSVDARDGWRRCLEWFASH